MNVPVGGATVNDKCTGNNEPIPNKVALLNPNQKNKNSIVCRRCQSLIFAPNMVSMVNTFRELKVMSVGGAGPNKVEGTNYWWNTENDLVFDTVGWQTVNGIKVLMCGDCEFGPIGLRESVGEKTSFLVAVERCAYI